MSNRIPPPPRGAGASGRRLWRSVQSRFVLDEHESALLREAMRTVDLLDQLAALVEVEGPLLDGKVHPAAVEARLQRVTLARLVASLRLPDDLDERPQRRGAARGTYRRRRGELRSVAGAS